jgi:hypothetical protein
MEKEGHYRGRLLLHEDLLEEDRCNGKGRSLSWTATVT